MTNPDSVLPVILVPSTTTTAGAGAEPASADGEDVDFGGAGFRMSAPPEAAAEI